MKKGVINISDSDKMFSHSQLFHLIWPLFMEQLLAVLVGIVDILMVSYVGEATVSGVSLVDSINILVFYVLFAMTAGGTVVCAGFIGAKKNDLAGYVSGQLMLIAVSLMLVVSTVFLIGGKYLLGLIFGSVTADVMENAGTYLMYTTVSYPFMAIYHASASVFRAKGNTRISMFVSLGMNLINIGGNALCIFGLKMGVEGVAIPTLIARIVGASVMLALLQSQRNGLRIRSLRSMKPNKDIIKQIFSIGIPNAIENGLFSLGKVSLQVLVSTLGTASIAAYAVAGSLVTYLYLPGNALGAALITIVGQCKGANENEQGKQYAKQLLKINYLMLAVICTVMIIGRSFWIGFYNLSAEASVLAEGLVLAHAVAMVIWPVAFLLPYYFRASGKAAFTMIIAVTAMGVFRIGLACIFVLLMEKNVLWIWYAMFCDWIFRTIIYSVAFRKQ